jgi:hypothetical protein
MLKMTARTILLCCGLCLLALMLASQAQRSVAQLDPTLQRQTLDAIINPRLTATARAINARTATAASIQLRTRAFFATLTQAALTATATPSHTPTVTPTLLPSDTPTITPTPTPSITLNPTQIFETIVFEVGRSLTQTAVVQDKQRLSLNRAIRHARHHANAHADLHQTPSPTPLSAQRRSIQPTNAHR